MQGLRRGGLPNCGDSTAPTPVVEVYTPITNGNSGWRRMGAVSKGVLQVMECFVGDGSPGQGLTSKERGQWWSM